MHAAEIALNFVESPPPALLSAGDLPQKISLGGVPRRHMDAVGYVGHRHLGLRPARKEALKDPAADLTVQPADSINSSRAAHGEIGHVERLRRIVPIAPAKRHQVRKGY